MLSEFFLKRKMASLIRRSRDPSGADKWESITALGKLPPTDESIACLIELTRMEQRHYRAAYTAASALGMMHDRRATDHLVHLLRDPSGQMDTAVQKALGQPHHASALPALAEMARGRCRAHDDVSGAKCKLNLMRSIDPVASQPYIEALASLVLESALRELPGDRPTYGAPSAGETILAWCQQPAGRAALQTFQDALVQHHRQIITTSNQFDKISNSLTWLKTSTRTAAEAAVTEFMRTPSRRVTQLVTRVISDDDDPAVRSISEEIGCDTSELGQPRSLEELAERDATGPAATDDTRQAYQAMKAEREHREKVYPDLCNLGDQRDLEDYAQACLKDAVYDAYFVPPAESHERSKPKLNFLVNFLRRAPDNAKAAELLQLILAGDRTRLWASTREAFVLRQTLPAWPPEINWKPLALELLEQTGYPTLDEFLTSQIEGGVSEPSLVWQTLERRNPAQSLELAARLLLGLRATKIAYHDLRWEKESARELLRDSLSGGENRDAALEVVLTNASTALRVACEMHARRSKRDRLPAYLIMCLLTGPEIEAELAAWLAAENDPRLADVLARHRAANDVQPGNAAPPPPEPVAPTPVSKPPIPEAPIVKTPETAAPIPDAPVPEVPVAAAPIPEARPATPAELWARVLAQLEKRRAIPAGSATPGDIARHADAVLGHDQVSRFVREYYYPAIYGESPVPAAALAWVEQFEKTA